MSFEDKKDKEINEESTIFSAPAEHKDKKKAGRFSRLRNLLVALLVLALVGGAVFGVIKLIPVLNDEGEESASRESVFFTSNPMLYKKMTINYGEEKIVFNSSMGKDENGETKQVWSLEGVDQDLIDGDAVSQVISYTSNVNKFGEYDYDRSKASIYGLDKPRVTVTMEGDSGNDFTLTLGNTTADGAYCYALLSTMPDKVAVVYNSVAAGFMISPLDLAISTRIQPIQKTDKNEKYFDEEGVLSTFDTITLEGAHFKNKMVFKPNNSGEFSSFANHICTTPLKRIAKDIDDLKTLFSQGLASSRTVSFDKSNKKLKEFGLDKPDWIITLSLAGEKFTYCLKATDETGIDYYVTSTTDKMIRVVTKTNLPFIEYGETDFYLKTMVMESINDISSFAVSGEANADFSISYNEEDYTYDIKKDGKKIEATSFQNFYASFLTVEVVDYNIYNVKGKSLTITLSHKDGSAPTVLTYTKVGDTRYQFAVGGKPMGQISSTAYNKMVRDLKAIK